MAPSNGTTSTPQTWSPPSPTVAHYNGTRRWHPAMAPTAPCNGTLVPRPIRQSGSSPSPPIGSKNPYSYRYLGKKNNTYWNHPFRSIKHLGMGVAIWWVIVFSPKMVVGCQLFNQFRPGDTPEVELLWEASHVMSTKEIDLLGGLELRFTRFVYLFLYIYIYK